MGIKTSTSFKPGQSGNPGGRPKLPWTWKSLIEDAMEEVVQTKEGLILPVKELVVKRIVAMAVNGDIRAIREIFNRMDGLPKQSLELDNSVGLTQDPKAMETIKETIIAIAEKLKNEQPK